MTDDQAWGLMLKYARSFEATDPDYNTLTSNSNTFVGALLAAASEDPYDVLPDGASASEAIGFSHFEDIVDDFAPPTDWRMLGTSLSEIFVGEELGEEFAASGGAGVVEGGAEAT